MSAFVVLLMRSWKGLILFWSPVEDCVLLSGPAPRPIREAGGPGRRNAFISHRFMLVDVGIWEIIASTIRITARESTFYLLPKHNLQTGKIRVELIYKSVYQVILYNQKHIITLLIMAAHLVSSLYINTIDLKRNILFDISQVWSTYSFLNNDFMLLFCVGAKQVEHIFRFPDFLSVLTPVNVDRFGQ